MPRKKISNRLLVILSVTAAALAMLIIVMALNPPAPAGSIYSNMYIHGIPVGGLTPDEADAALMQHFQPALDELVITFTYQSQAIAALSFKDFNVRFDFTGAIEAAIDYSNEANLPARISRLLGRARKITEPPNLRIDQARIDSHINAIANELQIEPVNASLSYESGQIVLKPESQGQEVDQAHISDQLHQIITNLSPGTIEMQTSPIAPKYTTNDFNFTVSSLGTFSTSIAPNEEGPRVRNIGRASGRVHNQMLFPGETLSASGLMGTHLPNSGYEAAIVLVRGEPVNDIGGGICQVVTTLYNAVLLAELTVVQRHNHSVRVSYAEYGFDATIAGDYYDLKFKNNTDYPILITSQLHETALTVTIHGHETRPANRTLQFSSSRVDVIPPEPYKEVVDQNLAPGERIVTLESQLGYRYEVFKHIFIDGQEVETVKINTSSYRPLQGIISVGRRE